MDAGIKTGTLVVQDEIGDGASSLVNALAGQQWVAAALALVVLVFALLKKFGILGAKKPVEQPAEVKPDADADKAADEARANLSMKDPEGK